MSDLNDVVTSSSVKSYWLYKITNMVNGKMYIGVSSRPEVRKREHLYENRGTLMNLAVKKYGEHNFKFEVLCQGECEYVYSLEKDAIKLYNTLSPNGYNLAEGGLGSTRESVPYRSDDEYVFVSGFWFPNKRVAVSKFNIDDNTYYSRKRKGSLGDTCHLRGSLNYGSYLYFRGFWFPSKQLPLDLFKISEGYLVKCVGNGSVEENRNVKTEHPKKKPKVLGVIYESLKEASKSLQIPYSTLSQRFLKEIEGYEYVYTQ